MATTMPTVLPAWKAAPIAKPSITLCPTERGRRGHPDALDRVVRVAVAVRVRGVLALVRAVDGHRALHDVQGEEAGHEHQQRRRHPEDVPRLGLQRLRQQVEADDSEHEPGGEAEHEMAAVADVLGDDAADRVIANAHAAIRTGMRP